MLATDELEYWDNPENSFKNFPPSLLPFFEEHSQHEFDRIVSELFESVENKDWDTFPDVLTQFSTYFSTCKYSLSNQDRVKFIQLLLPLLWEDSLGTRQRVNAVHQIPRLLKRKDLELSLDWKPLYELLFTKNKGHHPDYVGIYDFTTMFYPSIVRKARHYFPKGCTKEILDTARPLLNPFDVIYTQGITTLVLFLPTDEPHLYLDLVDEELSRRQLCNSEKHAWFSLLARTAKHNLGKLDWNDRMQQYFQIFMRSCGFAVQKQTNPCRTPWSSSLKFVKGGGSCTKEFAKLIVYTMTSESNTLDLLMKFLKTIRIYLHPQSRGSHKAQMKSFLSSIINYFAKRHAKENRGELDVSDGNRLKTLIPNSHPLVPLLFEAVHWSSASYEVLKLLLGLWPETCIPLALEDITANGKQFNKPRKRIQAASSMASLFPVVCDRNLFPSGHEYLLSLLDATLELMDPNNPILLRLAMGSLCHAFVRIPFFKPVAKESDPDHDQARSICFEFEDWSMRFMKKLFEVIPGLADDQASMAPIRICLHAFVHSLSIPIFKPLFDLVLEKSLDTQYIGSLHSLKTVFVTFLSAKPEITVPLAIPKIISLLQDSKGRIESEKKFVLHYLHLLENVLGNGRNHTIPFFPKLIRLMRELEKRSERAIYTRVANILNTVISAVSTFAVKDYQPFPEMAENTDEWQHWRDWGSFYKKHMKEKGVRRFDIPDLQLKWYEPTDAEIDELQKLVEEMVVPAMKTLKSADPKTLQDSGEQKKVEQALILLSTIGGLGSFLVGDFEGKKLDPRQGYLRSKSKQMDYTPKKLPYKILSVEKGVSLRTTLTRVFVQFFNRCLKNAESSSMISIFQESMRCVQGLLNSSQPLVSGVDMGLSIQYAINNDILSGYRIAQRKAFAMKAASIFRNRLSNYLFSLSYTQDVDDLLKIANLCCYSTQRTVRNEAMNSLSSEVVRRRFLPSLFPCCEEALEKFKIPRIDDERHIILGSLAVLNVRNILRYVGMNTERTIKYVTTLLNSHVHTHSEIQDAIHATVAPLLASSVQTDTSEQSISCSKELQAALVKLDRLPWRYELMKSLFIFGELRCEIIPSFDVVKYCFNLLLDRNPNIQRAGLYCMETLIAMFLPTKRETQMENSSNIPGWHPELNENVAHHSQTNEMFDKEIIDWIEKFLDTNLGTLVQVCLHDHEKLEHKGQEPPARGVRGTMQNRLSKLMRRMQMGKAELLLKSFKRHSQHTLYQLKKRDGCYTRHHSRLFRNIVFVYFHNKSILKQIENEVGDLKKTTSEDEYQYTAAELLAGLVRGHILRESLSEEEKNRFLNLFMAGLEKVNSDATSGWEQSFKFIIRKTNPEHVSWLTLPMVDRAFVEVENKNMDLSLRFLNNVSQVLMTEGFRGTVIMEKVLNMIEKNNYAALISPFRQVRSLLAFLFGLCIKNCSHGPDARVGELMKKIETRYMANFLTLAETKFKEYEELVETTKHDEKEEEKKEYMKMASFISLLVIYSNRKTQCKVLRQTIPKFLYALIQAESKYQTDQTLQTDAILACTFLSWCPYINSEELDLVLQEVFKVDEKSWRQKCYALHFLKPFIYINTFLFTEEQAKLVQKKVNGAFKAREKEVREEALKVQTALYLSGEFEFDECISKSMKKLKKRLPKKKKNTESTDEEKSKYQNALNKRLVGVLSLIALCGVDPYTVPDWMPKIVAYLTKFASNPSPIDTHVKAFIQSFKKTHEDSWEQSKAKFSHDELEDIRSVVGTYNYFA